MKKVLISSALAASLAIPSLAFEIYSDDDTKVNLYGSIRGYMGGSYTGNGSATDGRGGYLIGIQNNSHFGARFSHGNFKANVEFGASEPGVDGTTNGAPLRKFWGSYTTGAGEILFGKTDAPTTDIGFISNWLNNDNGAQGFGGVNTGNRKIQLQYNLAGLSVALVEDYVALGRTTALDEFPRISLAYTIKGDKGAPFFKVAYNYKKYTTSGSMGSVNMNKGDVAWDLWAAIRPTFGNAYLSVLASYGVDAHLYGEQTTNLNRGDYLNTPILATAKDVKRTGANVELGFNLGQKLALTLGGGYQKTFGKGVGGTVSGVNAYINLPYKVSGNFTFVPQVAYYNANGTATVLGGADKISSVIAAARFKWDF
ncbi:hypothetical protein LS68_003745 [Helicobacter sp. MIT 05-5293]|uniref:hypothetical protein n=1 Tax=Helicobacter sp. MIT 05-5293 TaxID=1548149 RepID=UPI00051D882F|nr:hypothetical protein [Helicobacter sp. MIT 05-5293]TLD82120.1 hypothetical protein LS68_003745 [Helicobacter sp. MIT 05-5293]